MADRVRGNVNAWASEGEQTNPGAAALMATTGAIASLGNYQAWIVIGATAVAEFSVQKRNAADATNVTSTVIYRAASDSAEFLFPFRIDNANERLRVVMNAALTGRASVSIHWELVA